MSTGSQLDGFGLEDQEQIVRRWIRQNNHKLVKLFVEKAVSGTVAGEERPEVAAALSWIEDKKAVGLVAPNLDRLARELVVQEAALGPDLEARRTRVHGRQGRLPDDPEDPMRTAMRQMMGVFAQLDRSMTVAKLRRGRRIKGEQGKYAYGAPPYGWQAHKKELTEEEMEQAGRARARQLRDEEELSFRGIAAALEAEGLSPKRGERWHPETVRRMLANMADRPPTLRRRERTS
ncbi:recombinase family protein [Streptomyces anulatus]|uniref:recombinase family protein n=1 Tax=Streptomyces anulatus TaxID=1892 RepID=UPI00364FF32E